MRGERQSIVEDFSTTILRGDRVGIIGPNGSGKTTLLNLLLGHLQPDSGRVKLGTQLQVAYFDQLRSQLNEESSVQDNVGGGSDKVEVGGKNKHIIGYLQDFLFTPERARSPVKALSGGERNRLLLAKLFTKPANILVLDEPTNDLDVETLELLEELLADYPGTLLLVSSRSGISRQCGDQLPGAWRVMAGWRNLSVATATGRPMPEPDNQQGRGRRTNRRSSLLPRGRKRRVRS